MVFAESAAALDWLRARMPRISDFRRDEPILQPILNKDLAPGAAVLASIARAAAIARRSKETPGAID